MSLGGLGGTGFTVGGFSFSFGAEGLQGVTSSSFGPGTFDITQIDVGTQAGGRFADFLRTPAGQEQLRQQIEAEIKADLESQPPREEVSTGEDVREGGGGLPGPPPSFEVPGIGRLGDFIDLLPPRNPPPPEVLRQIEREIEEERQRERDFQERILESRDPVPPRPPEDPPRRDLPGFGAFEERQSVVTPGLLTTFDRIGGPVAACAHRFSQFFAPAPPPRPKLVVVCPRCGCGGCGCA